MLQLILPLCLLGMPIVGAVSWPATENGALTETLDYINPEPWNVSRPFSNNKSLSGLFSNTTGHNISLGEALWPNLDTYNYVSFLLSY